MLDLDQVFRNWLKKVLREKQKIAFDIETISEPKLVDINLSPMQGLIHEETTIADVGEGLRAVVVSLNKMVEQPTSEDLRMGSHIFEGLERIFLQTLLQRRYAGAEKDLNELVIGTLLPQWREWKEGSLVIRDRADLPMTDI